MSHTICTPIIFTRQTKVKNKRNYGDEAQPYGRHHMTIVMQLSSQPLSDIKYIIQKPHITGQHLRIGDFFKTKIIWCYEQHKSCANELHCTEVDMRIHTCIHTCTHTLPVWKRHHTTCLLCKVHDIILTVRSG